MRRFLGYDEKSNCSIGEIVMLKGFFIVIRENDLNLRIVQLQRLAPSRRFGPRGGQRTTSLIGPKTLVGAEQGACAFLIWRGTDEESKGVYF